MSDMIEHVRATGVRCPCGYYHYACADCGADCTVYQPAGPACISVDGVTRCRECHAKNEARILRLHRATPDLLAALKNVRQFVLIEDDKSRQAVEQLDAAIAKAEGR
jgi:hypothetical protein